MSDINKSLAVKVAGLARDLHKAAAELHTSASNDVLYAESTLDILVNAARVNSEASQFTVPFFTK